MIAFMDFNNSHIFVCMYNFRCGYHSLCSKVSCQTETVFDILFAAYLSLYVVYPASAMRRKWCILARVMWPPVVVIVCSWTYVCFGLQFRMDPFIYYRISNSTGAAGSDEDQLQERDNDEDEGVSDSAAEASRTVFSRGCGNQPFAHTYAYTYIHTYIHTYSKIPYIAYWNVDHHIISIHLEILQPIWLLCSHLEKKCFLFFAAMTRWRELGWRKSACCY